MQRTIPIEEDVNYLFTLTQLDPNDPRSIIMLQNLIEIADSIKTSGLQMEKRIKKDALPDKKQVAALLLRQRLNDLTELREQKIMISGIDLHNAAMQLARSAVEKNMPGIIYQEICDELTKANKGALNLDRADSIYQSEYAARRERKSDNEIEQMANKLCAEMEGSISSKELIRARAISNVMIMRFNAKMAQQKPVPGTNEHIGGRSLLDLMGNSAVTSVEKIRDAKRKKTSKVLKTILASAPARSALEADPKYNEYVLTASGIAGKVDVKSPRLMAGLEKLSDEGRPLASVLTRPLKDVLADKTSFIVLFKLLEDKVNVVALTFDEKSTTKEDAIALKKLIITIRSLGNDIDVNNFDNLARVLPLFVSSFKNAYLSDSKENASFMDFYLAAISEAVIKQSPRGKDMGGMSASHSTMFPVTGLAKEEFKNTKSTVLQAIMQATGPLATLVEKVLRSNNSQDNQIARARIVAKLSTPQKEAEKLMSDPTPRR